MFICLFNWLDMYCNRKKVVVVEYPSLCSAQPTLDVYTFSKMTKQWEEPRVWIWAWLAWNVYRQPHADAKQTVGNMKLKFRGVWSEVKQKVFMCEALCWYTVNEEKINQTLQPASNKAFDFSKEYTSSKALMILWKITMKGKSILWPQEFSWNYLHVSYIQTLNCFNRIQLIKMWIICTLILIHFLILSVLFAHPLIVTKEPLKYNIN